MEVKFFICRHCGNIITKLKDSKVPVVCCGEKMQEIKANSTEAATEKHLPVITKEGNCVGVKIGSIAHPMTEAHLIEWVAIQTQQGFQVKYLKADDKPELCFHLCESDSLIASYAYCNLHGLWVTKA